MKTADGANKKSLWGKALGDPALRRRIERGRRQARIDQQHMEIWAGADFQSRGLTPNDPSGKLEVEEGEGINE